MQAQNIWRFFKNISLQNHSNLDAFGRISPVYECFGFDQSFYDEVKAGKQAFSEQQAKGEIAFNRFCNSCHQAPLFFSNDYASNRLEYTTDFGRFEITGNTADKGLFRIPTLRNISHTFPYMHDGRFKT